MTHIGPVITMCQVDTGDKQVPSKTMQEAMWCHCMVTGYCLGEAWLLHTQGSSVAFALAASAEVAEPGSSWSPSWSSSGVIWWEI